MTMYRRVLAVVGVVLVVAGVGGFFMLKESAVGPSPWADQAQVTGYATSNVSGRTTGAVSVELNGESAARIDQIVAGLPPANLAYLCAKNEQEYHISFSANAGAGVRQDFGLTGYWCNNLVVETLSHGTTMDRIDRDCALLAAVRRLLPARDRKTPVPKTPGLKTPGSEAPRHRVVKRGAPVRVISGHRTPRPRDPGRLMSRRS